MSNVRKKLGMNIREVRLLVGISQEKLADMAGLHRTYIGSVERGERNVSIENIVAIAKALSVNPTRLIEGID